MDIFLYLCVCLSVCGAGWLVTHACTRAASQACLVQQLYINNLQSFIYQSAGPGLHAWSAFSHAHLVEDDPLVQDSGVFIFTGSFHRKKRSVPGKAPTPV
jgi:hypothetical protein